MMRSFSRMASFSPHCTRVAAILSLGAYPPEGPGAFIKVIVFPPPPGDLLNLFGI